MAVTRTVFSRIIHITVLFEYSCSMRYCMGNCLGPIHICIHSRYIYIYTYLYIYTHILCRCIYIYICTYACIYVASPKRAGFSALHLAAALGTSRRSMVMGHGIGFSAPKGRAGEWLRNLSKYMDLPT